MSDFKWEMQERIDAGMNPDAAYEATRDAYADWADNARKRAKEARGQDPDTIEAAAIIERLKRQEKADMERYGHRAAWRCDPDESGGVRDDDDASAGGA